METLHQSALQQGTGGDWGGGITIFLLYLLQTTDVVRAFYTTAATKGSISSGVRVSDVFPAMLQRDTIALM